MRILIVADKNGVGHIKAYSGPGSRFGEDFWIGGGKFRVTKDNRIKLGKKFMEKHGFLRSDGRRAIIIDTGVWTAEHKSGAKILTGRSLEPYYEKRNGSWIPLDIGD